MRFSTGMPGLDRYPPGFSPEWAMRLSAADFQRIARAADELGYDAVNIPEHILMPDDLAQAMGAHWPHALTAMAFVAGATTNIKVNSCVIVLPYHNPIALAKAVATLDVMSGGRVILTFGVGHAEHEFESLGMDQTVDGDMLLIKSKGTGRQLSPTSVQAEGVATFMTQSKSLGWLNSAKARFEGTYTTTTGEFIAKVFAQK